MSDNGPCLARALGQAERHAPAQAALFLDERSNVGDTLSGADVGEHERPFAAHLLRVAVHDFQAGSDIRGKIDLVDDQKVAAGDARAALAGDFIAGGNVDDVDRQIRQFRAEGRGEVVAAGFDQDQIEVGKPPA